MLQDWKAMLLLVRMLQAGEVIKLYSTTVQYGENSSVEERWAAGWGDCWGDNDYSRRQVDDVAGGEVMFEQQVDAIVEVITIQDGELMMLQVMIQRNILYC